MASNDKSDDHLGNSGRTEVVSHIIPPLLCVMMSAKLGHHSLDANEILSLWRSISLERFTMEVLPRPHMAGYQLILLPWLRLGDSEAWVRLPSLLFAITTVVLTRHLGDRLLSRPAGFWGATLLAAAPALLNHAQYARAYSMAMLTGVMASWLLLRACSTSNRRTWVLFGLTSGFGLWVSYAFALLSAGHLASLRLLKPRGSGPALALVGWGAFVVPLLAHTNPGDHPMRWSPPLTLASFIDTLVHLAGNHLLLAVAFVFLCLALREKVKELRVLLSWVLVPILVLAAASYFRPMLAARYLACIVPFAALLTAAVLTSFPPRRQRSLLFCLSLVVTLTVSFGQQYQTERPVWPELLQQVAAECRPGDKVVFWGTQDWLEIPYLHYRLGLKLEILKLPGAAVGPDGHMRDAELVMAALRPHSRVWVISLEKRTMRRPLTGFIQQHALSAPGLSAILLCRSTKVQRAEAEDRVASPTENSTD